MSDNLDSFERSLDTAVLDALAAPEPSPRTIAAVKGAVRREAIILGRRRRATAITGRFGAFAAAVALAWGVLAPADRADSATVADASAALDEWTDALLESSDRLTRLVTEEWDANGQATDPEAELDELFDSLDASFMMGA